MNEINYPGLKLDKENPGTTKDFYPDFYSVLCFQLPWASARGNGQTGTYRGFRPKAGESLVEAGRILLLVNRGFTLIRLFSAFRLKPFGAGRCFYPGLKPGVMDNPELTGALAQKTGESPVEAGLILFPCRRRYLSIYLF